jgi:hypothetical protein
VKGVGVRKGEKGKKGRWTVDWERWMRRREEEPDERQPFKPHPSRGPSLEKKGERRN